MRRIAPILCGRIKRTQRMVVISSNTVPHLCFLSWLSFVLETKTDAPSKNEWLATEDDISMITTWQLEVWMWQGYSETALRSPYYHSQRSQPREPQRYSTQPHIIAYWQRNALSLRTKIPHTICVGKAARVRVLLLYSLQNKFQKKATENRASNEHNTSIPVPWWLKKKKKLKETPKIPVWCTASTVYWFHRGRRGF